MRGAILPWPRAPAGGGQGRGTGHLDVQLPHGLGEQVDGGDLTDDVLVQVLREQVEHALQANGEAENRAAQEGGGHAHEEGGGDPARLHVREREPDHGHVGAIRHGRQHHQQRQKRKAREHARRGGDEELVDQPEPPRELLHRQGAARAVVPRLGPAHGNGSVGRRKAHGERAVRVGQEQVQQGARIGDGLHVARIHPEARAVAEGAHGMVQHVRAAGAAHDDGAGPARGLDHLDQVERCNLCERGEHDGVADGLGGDRDAASIERGPGPQPQHAHIADAANQRRLVHVGIGRHREQHLPVAEAFREPVGQRSEIGEVGGALLAGIDEADGNEDVLAGLLRHVSAPEPSAMRAAETRCSREASTAARPPSGAFISMEYQPS